VAEAGIINGVTAPSDSAGYSVGTRRLRRCVRSACVRLSSAQATVPRSSSELASLEASLDVSHYPVTGGPRARCTPRGSCRDGFAS
jgi:hypothetical protein